MKNALILAIVGALFSHASYAEIEAIPMPGDNRLVVFPYDPNNTFTILTIPGSVTDITLSPDEKVEALALGDSVQWAVAKTEGHVFVRPLRPSLFTSATLVTDKRTYQITLRSGPLQGKWYQRVSWNYPDLIIFKEQKEASNRAASDAESHRKAAMVVSRGSGVPIENLNFNYQLKGESDFKPTQVFDDGTFTWIRFGRKLQEMPALFIQGEDSKYELVNYITQDEYLKVQRLFGMAVLKLGKEEIEIKNTTLMKSRKTTFSVFGVD